MNTSLNPIPIYYFTSEYYRALARIVLDVRFRNKMIGLRNSIDDMNNMLKDGGYSLDFLELKSLQKILNTIIVKAEFLNEIIGEINGIPIPKKINLNNSFPISDLKSVVADNQNISDVEIPTPEDLSEFTSKTYVKVSDIFNVYNNDNSDNTTTCFLMNNKETTPPVQVKSVRVVPE
ncbi:MAG: hypothetical protein U0W24_01250 [Bacteroidales bacterium]